jgi:hypothetical protein
MSRRAYDKVRSLVEDLGGSMIYVRKGYRYGAWIITIGEKSEIIEAEGNQSIPKLDRLYEPNKSDPKHWKDYDNKLVPDAEAKLLVMLGIKTSDS